MLEDQCDYVMLYRLDDSFTENYSSLFENKEDIHENSLYRLNKVTNMLEIVFES